MVAKYKREHDQAIREAGGIVKRGRIYGPDGTFWGPRVDWLWMPEAMRERYLELWRNTIKDGTE